MKRPTLASCALVAVLAFPLAARAGVSPSGGPTVRPAPTLRELAASAASIAFVRADSIESRDGGRIRLYGLKVERVLSGSVDAKQIRLVELRIGTTRSPLLERNDRAMVLLQPMARVSYLLEHIPETDVWQSAGGTGGLVRYSDDAEATGIAGAIECMRSVQAPAGIRACAFAQLAAQSDRLVEDAVQELSRLPALGTLSEGERKAVTAVLSDAKRAVQTRVVLIEVLGASRDASAAGILARLRADDPRVLEASLRARAAVGVPATASELERHLASSDGMTQAAALRALAVSRHPRATAILAASAAPSRPREVRLAAIDSMGEMGETGGAETLAPLAAAFESDERGIKQASARAILRVGGPEGDDTLVELARRGASRETRIYAAMLLTTRYSSKHPAVVRLASSGPPPDVIEVLEKGLQDSHGHHE